MILSRTAAVKKAEMAVASEESGQYVIHNKAPPFIIDISQSEASIQAEQEICFLIVL